MNKLTQQEAQLVLQEAYRLKAECAGTRMGQSIWWVASGSYLNPLLSKELQKNLFNLLDFKHDNDVDFYHWTDDNNVLQCFYEHFVEQY